LSEPPLIAVVDDDEAVRDALCDLLQVEGLSACSFESAGAFLDAYSPRRFDLLITDVRMPHVDGIELLARLRTMQSALPAIVLTSLSDDTTSARAKAEGALACLTKPVADEGLLALVGSVVGRRSIEPPED